MKTEDAMNYLVDKALEFGYTPDQIKCFRFELRERISEMPECDEDDLLKLFDEIF